MTNAYYTSPTDVEAGVKVRSVDLNTLDASVDSAFDKLPTENNLKRGTTNYAVDTGTANAYVVSLPHTPSGYVDGLTVRFRAINTNTGASTINVNSLGTKSIRNRSGSALAAGDITVGVPLEVIYSTATGFFHLSENSAVSATAAASSATAAASSASSASSSASAAASSATSAASSASAASTSETNAASSASSASTSASTATTQASNASTSATNAASSATTATTKASEASTSATNAASSASSASTSATNASNSASAAATSATNASNSASSASTSATNAANSATAAAASAATINLPSITGNASNMLRAKADETGHEYRTPAQVRSDISAAASGAVTGSGLTMATARLLGRTTASTGAIEEISVTGATLSGGALTIASAASAATQAEMEAASSNTVMATPGTMNWHPGVAKVWIKASGNGTAISASHNVTSITDDGTGTLIVTIATDFSSANYVVVTGVEGNFGTQAVSVANQAAGSFKIFCAKTTTGATEDPTGYYYAACFGDQ